MATGPTEKFKLFENIKISQKKAEKSPQKDKKSEETEKTKW